MSENLPTTPEKLSNLRVKKVQIIVPLLDADTITGRFVYQTSSGECVWSCEFKKVTSKYETDWLKPPSIVKSYMGIFTQQAGSFNIYEWKPEGEGDEEMELYDADSLELRLDDLDGSEYLFVMLDENDHDYDHVADILYGATGEFTRHAEWESFSIEKPYPITIFCEKVGAKKEAKKGEVKDVVKDEEREGWKDVVKEEVGEKKGGEKDVTN